MSRKIIYFLIFLLIFFSFGPSYALDGEKLLKLKPLVSERFVKMADEEKNATALTGNIFGGIGLAALTLAALEQNNDAKMEYIAFGGGLTLAFLSRYLNLFPGRMQPHNDKIKLSKPGSERETLAYNSLKQLADEDRNVKSWNPPLAIVFGASAFLMSNSYITGLKFLLIGIGVGATGWGIYHLFVPVEKSSLEMEFEAVEAELKKENL